MSILTDLSVAVLNGITWGLAIALVALGLSMIFGLLEIVNLSHGSLYMLGAVIAWFIIDWTGSFLAGLILAPLAVGVIGVVLERGVLRPIEDDIPGTLIATFGFLLIFQQLALIGFGSGVKSIQAPITDVLKIGGITYPVYRILIAVASILTIGLIYVFLNNTRHGLWMRGVRQDRETADALGVPTSRVYMLTFGLGSVLAALAGVLLAPILGVSHLMGLNILTTAFAVVIVGGLRSQFGVVVVSIIYGLINNVGSLFVRPTTATIFTLSVLIGVVLVRPEGIFSGVQLE